MLNWLLHRKYQATLTPKCFEAGSYRAKEEIKRFLLKIVAPPHFRPLFLRLFRHRPLPPPRRHRQSPLRPLRHLLPLHYPVKE